MVRFESVTDSGCRFVHSCVDDDKEFSILTYNTHLFDLIGHFGWDQNGRRGKWDIFWEAFARLTFGDQIILDDSTRALFMIDRILKLGEMGPDVIVFTEVWSEAQAQRLIKGINYAHYYRPNYHKDEAEVRGYDDVSGQAQGWVFDSGLLILSKHKIVKDSAVFEDFDDLSGEDRLTTKGIARVTLELPNKNKLGVIFTHTQANYGRNEHRVILKNIRQVQGVVENYKENFPDHDIFVAGDFNIAGDTIAYEVLLDYFDDFFLKDTYREFYDDKYHEAYFGHTYDKKNNDLVEFFPPSAAMKADGERLDYLFHYDNGAFSHVKHVHDPSDLRRYFRWYSDQYKYRDLSDHFPLLVRFRLR